DSYNSVGASFGDFDNDLDLDLFVANASDQPNLLYINDGAGNFMQVTSGWVAGDKGNSHGSVWADLDNDGWQDLIVLNDQDGSKFLYMNNGDGTFCKVTNSPFISPRGNSFSIVSTDLELDGDLDLVISNHSNEKNRIFRNDLAVGNYLLVRLEGTNSNRSAIGARIYVNAVIDGENRTLLREVMGQTGGGPSSQSSLTQHFGLGDASSVISVEVQWPSGYEQILNDISPNQLLDIREDDGATIDGYVYHDQNDNCQKDANEQPLANTLIKVNNGSLYAMTDESGYYEISLPIGNYSIQQEVPTNFESTCQPNPHSVNITTVGQTFSSLDFPNKGISSEPDLAVELSTTALRRGFDNEMVLYYANISADDAYDVTIELILEEPLVLSQASVPWTSQTGNTYIWQIDTVLSGAQSTIQLMNYVDLTAELGQTKNLNATIGTKQEESNYENNDHHLTEPIVGSLDPNDMLVTPEGIGSGHLIHPETRLNYKIRFQNVGNYPATYVTVIDTLPEQLDPSTFRLGGSSHLYQFEMLENNVLKWYFHEINLVDSVSNEPESHGFVKFSIKPKPDLDAGTTIVNRASIKFDFNPFIITNECISTISRYAAQIDDDFRLIVFPNPASNHVECYLVNQDSYRNGEARDRGVYRIDIFDQSGTMRLSNSFTSPASVQQLDISALSSGLYMIQYQDDLGVVKRAKLIKGL
ncbi:MAG: FG-GAP-like repeat-containing protein, partial [Cytophagales bacterium]|nr:FG-GAP-like repeat-containing protein [Cytophagales bacterium]